jgi:hypothetical protein
MSVGAGEITRRVQEIARRSVATPALAGVEPDGWRKETLQLRRNREKMSILLANLTEQFTQLAGADFEPERAEQLAECSYWIQQLGFMLHVPLPRELFRHRLRVKRQNL